MHNYIVKLNNIKIRSLHGLHETEKTNKQTFEIDIAICFHRETCSDNIEKSINYEYVYNIIVEIFSNNSFNLIETLGEKIIDKIYNAYSPKKIAVTIRKPEIIFGNNPNCIEVTIERSGDE